MSGSEFLYDSTGHPIFRMETKEKGSKPRDVSVNFAVYEVTAWDEHGKPTDEELYLRAYMKWDNCNHFWFGEGGESDGYLHICGAKAMQNHIRLMAFLYDHAFAHMQRPNEEPLGITTCNRADKEET